MSRAQYISDMVLTDLGSLWIDSRAYASINDAIEACDGFEQAIVVGQDSNITGLSTGDYSKVVLHIPKGITLTISSADTYNFSLLIKDGAQVLIDEDVTINGNIESKGSSAGVVDFDAVDGDETLTISGGIDAGLWQIFGSNLSVLGITKQEKIYPQWFGGFSDGSFYTDELQKWCQFKSLYVPEGTYKTNDELLFAKDCRLTGNGTLSAEGATGSFSSGAVFMFSSNIEPSSLPALSSDISAGDESITFSSDPALSIGDVIIIYNPTDYSWSGFRPQYRAGEFLRVESISSSTIYINGVIVDDYTAASVDVYKLNTTSPVVDGNLSFIGVADDSAIDTVCFQYADKFFVQNIKATLSGDKAIRLTICYDGEILAYANQQNDSGLGTQYGISIDSCQSISVRGKYYGNRHGAKHGSGGSSYGVPNRFIDLSGQFYAKKQTACDIHGNGEFIIYHDFVANGGISLSGDNNKLINGWIFANSEVYGGAPIIFSELLGFNFQIENIKLVSHFNTTDSSRAFIDIGSNDANTLTDDTTRQGHLILNKLDIYAPNLTSSVFNAENRGCIENQDITLTNLTIKATNAANIGRTRVNSGANFGKFTISNIRHNLSSGYWSLVDITSVNGINISGSTTLSTGTASGVTNTTVTFPFEFPKAPVVTVSIDNAAGGSGKSIVSQVDSISATQAVIKVYTSDDTNFDSDYTITIYWQASLNEF